MKLITEAMDGFFRRQDEKWRKFGGCRPLYPWDEKFDQRLFISEPDDEGYAEWLPQEGQVPVGLPPLCPELRLFYGKRRFWQMTGEYQGYEVDFPAVPTDEEAVAQAKAAIEEGRECLKNIEKGIECLQGKSIVMMASVSYRGMDEMYLLYDQKSGDLFLFDAANQSVRPLGFSLVDLIDGMEAQL